MASWINHPSRYSLFLSRPLMNTGPFRREATLSSPVAFPRLDRFLLNPARFPFKGDFPQGPSLHGRYSASPVSGRRRRPKANLRPPLKLDVQFSRIQLSQRCALGAVLMKVLGALDSPACTRRIAWLLEAVSSPHYANACSDVTVIDIQSNGRDG